MYKNISRVAVTFLLSALLADQSFAVEAPGAETPAVETAPTPDTGGLVFYGALSFGGDTLATAVNEDGDDYDLEAGGLCHLAIGYEKRSASGGMRVTLGYKFDSLDADNGNADISRFPLEAVLYKRFAGKHNLGGGVVYEISPEFELSIDGAGSNGVDFDDAVGLVGYYGYSTGAIEWGLRYTHIEYEHPSFEDVDAGNIGFYANYFLD